MKKLILKKGFIVQKLGKKTVIFDGEQSILYTFNDIASFIFSKLKSGWGKNKIIKKISSVYKQNPEKVERDFEALISDLIRNKIVSSSKQ